MYRFKKSLIALIGVLTLVGIITVTVPHIGRGASSTSAPTTQTQNVKVVNTPGEAVPVAGTVAPGTGTVWNVGVVGTPNVAVSNFPATTNVAIDSSANTVKIDTSNPVSVRDVDNPARQPYQEYQSLQIPPGEYSNQVSFTPVPAGKRIVIEFVSVFGRTPIGQTLQRAVIDVGTNPPIPFDIMLAAQGRCPIFIDNGACDQFGGSQQVRLYSVTGSAPQLFALRSDTAGTAYVQMNISGYYVDDVP